jgi:hypothetical protein
LQRGPVGLQQRKQADQGRHHHARHDQPKRDALVFTDDVLSTRFTRELWDAFSLRPLKRAKMQTLSTMALGQSILSANPNSLWNAFPTLCQTPSTCRSRRRRQHAIPLPQPNSRGIGSQPFVGTNNMRK